MIRGKWFIVFLIWLMMLVAYMDRVNISFAGPAIMGELRLSKTEFGFVLSAFLFGYALLHVPGGWLSDKVGAKPLLVSALLLWSFFTGLTGLAFSLVSLVAIRVFFGMGEGIANGAQFKLIGDSFGQEERSSANGFFLTAIALGPAIATPLATWLIAVLGWRKTFFCFSILGLLVSGLLWFFLPHEKRIEREMVGIKHLGPLFKNTRTRLVCLAYLLFNIAFWGYLGWIPTYLKEQRHISLAQMGSLGMLPYLCGFVGLVVAGNLGAGVLSNRREGIVAVCYFMAACALYMALSVGSIGACVAGLSLAALFLFGGFGPFWAIALDIATPETRGVFTGAVNLGGQLGGFVGQIAIGFLADRMKSFDGALILMTAAVAVAGVCMVLAARSGIKELTAA